MRAVHRYTIGTMYRTDRYRWAFRVEGSDDECSLWLRTHGRTDAHAPTRSVGNRTGDVPQSTKVHGNTPKLNVPLGPKMTVHWAVYITFTVPVCSNDHYAYRTLNGNVTVSAFQRRIARLQQTSSCLHFARLLFCTVPYFTGGVVMYT